jgi:hypothetical protein
MLGLFNQGDEQALDQPPSVDGQMSGSVLGRRAQINHPVEQTLSIIGNPALRQGKQIFSLGGKHGTASFEQLRHPDSGTPRPLSEARP